VLAEDLLYAGCQGAGWQRVCGDALYRVLLCRLSIASIHCALLLLSLHRIVPFHL
jgi:hypothetical protein